MLSTEEVDVLKRLTEILDSQSDYDLEQLTLPVYSDMVDSWMRSYRGFYHSVPKYTPVYLVEEFGRLKFRGHRSSKNSWLITHIYNYAPHGDTPEKRKLEKILQESLEKLTTFWEGNYEVVIVDGGHTLTIERLPSSDITKT